MTGPPLTGVIGRRAGSLPDYPYSEALRASGLVWDAKTLARFIADPQAVAPGSRMIFAGLPQNEIDALVSYIETVGTDDVAAKTLPSSALAIGGPFTLVDTHGAVVTQRDFLGKPSAIFFGYTHCPDVCPTTLLDLTELMKAMGADADKLNVAFVTVDPDRDTPAQLADYLSSFDPRIRGLTGTEAQIAAAAKAYHVYYARVPDAARRLRHGPYGVSLSDERRRRIRWHDEFRGRRQDFARQTRTTGEAGDYGHGVTVTAVMSRHRTISGLRADQHVGAGGESRSRLAKGRSAIFGGDGPSQRTQRGHAAATRRAESQSSSRLPCVVRKRSRWTSLRSSRSWPPALREPGPLDWAAIAPAMRPSLARREIARPRQFGARRLRMER